MIDKLSVFFPAYNEEKNIKDTVSKARDVLENLDLKDWEILVINDGSGDKTGEVIQDLVAEDKRIKLLGHKINQGYGAALKTGFYNSHFDWIAFTDSDGQFDFSEIKSFLEKQEETGADLVIGFYKKRAVSFFRIWGSKLWELSIFLFFGLRVKDVDCGFKLISKRVIETIPHLEAERGPFISSELLIKAKTSGFKMVEIPVSHFPRKEGQATGASLKVILSGFRDLIKLKVR